MPLHDVENRTIKNVKRCCRQEKSAGRHGVLLLWIGLFVLVGGRDDVQAVGVTGAAVPCPSVSYHILWNGVPAGKAVLQCVRTADRCLVQLEGETHAFLSSVYPMKIKAESRVLADGTASVEYREKIREGRKKEKTELLLFDRDPDKVEVFKNGKFRRTLHVLPETMDPLGGLYRFLGNFQRAPASCLIRVTDGRRVFEVQMKPLEREEIRTPLGTRPAQVWRAEVRVVSGKPHVLEKSPMHVWMSEGTSAVLLKAEATLPYGDFSALIQGITGPQVAN